MASNAPAGTHDYVYPALIERLESSSIDKGESEATGHINNPIARDIIPELDFEETEDTVWDGESAGWDQTPDAEGWDAGEFTVYEVDSDTGKAERRVNVVYGFEVIEGGDMVKTIRFRGSDDQVFERAKVEGLSEDADTPVDRQKVLRSPVAFGPQDNGTISFELADGEAEDEVKIKLLGVTVEKQGRRVGSRT